MYGVKLKRVCSSVFEQVVFILHYNLHMLKFLQQLVVFTLLSSHTLLNPPRLRPTQNIWDQPVCLDRLFGANKLIME